MRSSSYCTALQLRALTPVGTKYTGGRRPPEDRRLERHSGFLTSMWRGARVRSVGMAAGDAPAEFEARSGREERSMEGNAKTFWRHMEGHEVDLVFEQLQKLVLDLKQKIKSGTATEEVNNVQEDTQKYELDLQLSPSAETTSSSADHFPLTEVASPRDTGEPAGVAGASLRRPCRPHSCSPECLVERPWCAYKGGNPLHLPLRCHFQRRHAKPDLPSKVLDVVYKAPCGRSLRNFEEVQDYLRQTECHFLFLDQFSFNTYVQVFRNYPSRKGLVFDFDISNGAESAPVSFCNEANQDRLPYFKYRKTSWPRGLFLNNCSGTFLASCNCTDGCRDTTNCACLLLTQKSCAEASASPGEEPSYGYKYKRLDGPISSGIYECNLSCSCDKMRCQNRVVQHGVQVRLQVFNTEKKGWGVRCLDDLDKGTFVCTYAGRLMSRDKSRQAEGEGRAAEAENTENSDRNHALSSRKRKVDSDCSDAEIELVQTGKDSPSGKQKAQRQPHVLQSCGYKDGNWRNEGIKRPQTRTSVLQRHRRQLGISDATSSEDESPVCRTPARRHLITGMTKGGEKPSVREELGEPANAGLPGTDPGSPAKSPPSNTCLPRMSVVQDGRSIKKPCPDLFWTGSSHKGEDKRSGLELACKEAMEGNESHIKQFNREDLCLLDATREGNVGRFLNHSCCPNLFVQSVFVETHNRNFPWVAFFTNRHVKAGTELTWDYGYLPGSMPETEIPCQCGSHRCRKKIL